MRNFPRIISSSELNNACLDFCHNTFSSELLKIFVTVLNYDPEVPFHLFQKNYWCGTKQGSSLSSDTGNLDPKYFERDPNALSVGISINHLRKARLCYSIMHSPLHAYFLRVLQRRQLKRTAINLRIIKLFDSNIHVGSDHPQYQK